MKRFVLGVLLLASSIAVRAQNAPEVEFSTLIGGRAADYTGYVAFDGAGNIVLAGSTASPDFVLGNGAAPRLTDAFAAKISADGSRVLWSRYIGGSRLDDVLAMTADRSGNIYIAGRTDSPDFPITANAPQKTLSGGIFDSFIVKLSPEGELLFGTYWGGSGGDAPDGIAADAAGNIVIAGDTSSRDYPLVRPLQTENRGGTDMFIARFSPSGSAVFSTLLGGVASDIGRDVVLDGAGNAIVLGAARSDDFPVSPNALQRTYGGGAGDAVIVKLAPDGTLISSTYFGAERGDYGDGIAIAPDGNVWVLLRTDSAAFPLVNPRQNYGGALDAIVARLTPAIDRVLFSTFSGGSAFDAALAISFTREGHAVVCGESASLDFPVRRAVQPENGGGNDAWLMLYAPDGGGVVFSTYFGGISGIENCSSVAVSASNAVAMAGYTNAQNFPLKHPLHARPGGLDTWLAKIEVATDVSLAVNAPVATRIFSHAPWLFTLTNTSALDATDVELTVEFSQPVRLSDASVPCTLSGQTLRCTIGTLPVRGQSEVRVTVQPLVRGELVGEARVSAAEPQRTADANRASGATRVRLGVWGF